MGAKTAVKLRTRGAAYKCELCGRKLMSPEALVSHQRTAHNIVTRRTKPKPVEKPIKIEKMELITKDVKKSPSPSKESNKIQEEGKTESLKRKLPSTDTDLPTKRKTVDFECPKCFRIFSTYFPAHKHIQKYHCVNRQGIKVPPNSPSLIQPVRIELCVKCNRKVKSIQTHLCDDHVKEKAGGQVFLCTACEEWFPNLKSFDIHVLSLHGDEVESMFFPTSVEFIKWKVDMEAQMNVGYVLLDKYDSKRYYHCNSHQTQKNPKKASATYFCPSTIVIQEFSKGIQVHFYKQHFQHCFVDYSLSEKYKKYSITSFLKRSEEYSNLPSTESDTNDLYLQFKTLIEGIVVDAAKLNIPSLKVLIGKALDMTSILTNYDEEIDDSQSQEQNTNQSMSDAQITKALEEACQNIRQKNNDTKNKQEAKHEKFEFCKNESDTSSPKIVNSFSLANQDDMNVMINKYGKEIKDKVDNVKLMKFDKLKKSDKSEKSEKSERSEKSEKSEKTEKSSKSNGKDEVVKDMKTMKRVIDLDQSPSSFNDSYRDFVVKNFPIPESEIKRRASKNKPVVKTKIGQYKPISPKPTYTIEPKRVVPSQPPIRKSFDKPKVDYKYEIKEQDGECNILILKM